MNCPKCDEPLRGEIYRKKDYQVCFYCEATWINGETVKEESIQNLLEITGIQTDYRCPDCINQHLVKANSDDIELEYCRNCNGLFFDRGVIHPKNNMGKQGCCPA